MRTEQTLPLVVGRPRTSFALSTNRILPNSVWGLAAVFGLTGFMGYTLGPIVSHYLAMPNGHLVVMMAMGGIATFFVGLSAYAMTSRKDFSIMGGFLLTRIIGALPGRIGGHLLPGGRPVAHRLGGVRVPHGRPDPDRNPPHRAWRRNQLRHGHGEPLRLDLQPVQLRAGANRLRQQQR